jgi:lipid-A-disaccharide synthase
VTGDIQTRPGADRNPTPVNRHRIGIVAGEASGDLLGSLLIKSLRDAGHDLDFQGIAGPKMQALGAHSLFSMETRSVRGDVEALSGLRRILAIRRDLKRRMLADPPRLFLGIDAPDFNLALEADLRRHGIPTVHFISPSVWAWRRGRLDKIRRAVSHMLLVFPFEEAIYREVGIPATYVGHPLAHSLPERPDRQGAAERLDLRPGGTYLALLPGSRQGELRQHASLLLETARRLAERQPGIRFLVPIATRETRILFEAAMHECQAGELPIRIVFGHAHDVLQAADAAIIASGTATLEALLLDCPHLITYRVPWLTAQIMKRQAYLPWVGLPNILADRQIVPEFLQEAATPDTLAEAALALLSDAAARQDMRTAFADLRLTLRRDTPRLIADALAPFLQ